MMITEDDLKYNILEVYDNVLTAKIINCPCCLQEVTITEIKVGYIKKIQNWFCGAKHKEYLIKCSCPTSIIYRMSYDFETLDDLIIKWNIVAGHQTIEQIRLVLRYGYENFLYKRMSYRYYAELQEARNYFFKRIRLNDLLENKIKL